MTPLFDAGYWDQAFGTATKKLGIDSGEAAVGTIGKLLKSTRSDPAPQVAAAAQAEPEQSDKIFGLEKKTALMVGAAALIALLLLARKSKGAT